MIDEFLNVDPVIWILTQAFVQKVPSFSRYEDIRGNADLVLYNLYQFFFFCYLEWVFTHQHLVHHYAKRPNVNLLVVLLSLQDLRANVEGSPTESCPQSVVLVDRPAEVAKLDNVLARVVSTSWRTMFSGLMSLWMILREWISLTASQTCFIMVATLTSGRGSDLRS